VEGGGYGIEPHKKFIIKNKNAIKVQTDDRQIPP
jgi:hypothetical protein